MPRRKRPISFWIVIKDHKTGTFNMIGRLNDDRPWDDAVCQAKQEGRPLGVETFDGNLSEVEVINRVRQGGFRLTEAPILASGVSSALRREQERVAPYNGSLPQYAQGANRRRVVKIVCRGKCRGGHTTWAEMTIDHPGDEKLRQLTHFDVTARCLRCGYEAKDPYNWFR